MSVQIVAAVCRIKPGGSRMLARTAAKIAAKTAAKTAAKIAAKTAAKTGAMTYANGLPPASGAAASAPTAAIACGNSVYELIRRSAPSAAGATSL